MSVDNLSSLYYSENTYTYLTMDISLKWPFNMLVCGPTQSGKTMWVVKLLAYRSEIFEAAPKRVLWYSPHDKAPEEAMGVIPTLIHHQGLPWVKQDTTAAAAASGKSASKLKSVGELSSSDDDDDDDDEDDDGKKPSSSTPPPPETEEGDLVIIDDFAEEIANSRELTAYLTRHSHHRSISILLISQNCFWSGREARTQSLNMHYIVLMRQKRDQKQIRTLARQIASGESTYRTFMKAYNDATSQRPFAYLLVSVHPRDDEALLLRTNIFPDESEGGATTVYMTEKKYKKLSKRQHRSLVDSDTSAGVDKTYCDKENDSAYYYYYNNNSSSNSDDTDNEEEEREGAAAAAAKEPIAMQQKRKNRKRRLGLPAAPTPAHVSGSRTY